MTRDNAIRYFVRHILPSVRAHYEQDGKPNYPARCEAWNNWTDALCKDGQITPKQYDTWAAPLCCGGRS